MLNKCLLLSCIFLLVGCGFAPMNRLSGDRLVTDLTETVAISNIPNSDGYILKQQLQDNFNPNKKNVKKKYQLRINLKSPLFTDQSIQGDNFASRQTMSITCGYDLTDIETGKTLVKDSTRATGSYNVVKEPYATHMAKQKLKENLIKVVSDNITIRIVSYLKTLEKDESKTDTN